MSSLTVQPQTASYSFPLIVPVGHLMRPTVTVASEDTVYRAVTEFKANGGGILPIVSNGVLVGVIGEKCLTRAAADNIDILAPCTEAMCPAPTIHPYASGSEALRLFSDLEVGTLVVVDDHRRVMGVISPSDLFPKRKMLPRPAMVGGMATPFGVYLTSGGLRGGVNHLAVMATGVLMFSSLVLCIVATHFIVSPLEKSHLPDFLKVVFEQAIPYLGFVVILRLIPLSGFHGAEHMVVHAMERGEELTPEVVARMPRVHPRCGTNIAVGMFLFLTIWQTPWIKYDDVRAITGAILTLFLWRPVGAFVQQHITTKKPTSSQLRSGIKAGNDLIERYSTTHSSTASIPVRIWNSGMLQVVAGSSLILLLLKGLMMWLHFDLPGLE